MEICSRKGTQSMDKHKEDIISKIERLYAKHRNIIYIIAYGILNDTMLAEEAVQETVIKLIRYSDALNEDKEIPTKNYIVRVAKSVSIDIYNRREKERAEVLNDEEIAQLKAEFDPQEYVITKESVDTIVQAINNMDDKYRLPLLYSRINGYRAEQIADIMGISERTVYSRLKKAKQILAKALKREEEEI